MSFYVCVVLWICQIKRSKKANNELIQHLMVALLNLVELSSWTSAALFLNMTLYFRQILRTSGAVPLCSIPAVWTRQEIWVRSHLILLFWHWVGSRFHWLTKHLSYIRNVLPINLMALAWQQPDQFPSPWKWSYCTVGNGIFSKWPVIPFI